MTMPINGKTENLNRPIVDNEIGHLRLSRMAVIKNKGAAKECTAILEDSMKALPEVKLIDNLSEDACISHSHDHSTVLVAKMWRPSIDEENVHGNCGILIWT